MIASSPTMGTRKPKSLELTMAAPQTLLSAVKTCEMWMSQVEELKQGACDKWWYTIVQMVKQSGQKFFQRGKKQQSSEYREQMQQRRALLKERAQLREQLHALHPQQCTTLTSGIREDWPHAWLPQNACASLNAPLALTNAGYTGWEQGMRTLHTTEAPAVSPPQPHSTLPPQLLHHGQICNTAETGQLRSSDQNNTQDFNQHGPQGSQNKPRGTPKIRPP